MIDDSRYEMRLALVLNGGVSLAVWMGGVTAEIDRMRRAAYPALMHGGGDPVLRRWEHLLERLRVRLIVDVIAGASAGGLNGAVLAAAIARGQPLPELRNVWRSVGSIENLASSEGEPVGVDRLSVLNGDLLTASIAQVFDGLSNAPGLPADAGLRKHLEHEAILPRGVTLFTTATSLRGRGETFADSTNQRFTQVENRVLCRFRRPLVGADEFNDDTANWRLTRAARASASFPAAFEPTFFRAGDGVAAGQPEITQVQMSRTATLTASRWMIDGGVLDNEPFAPVLDRIARRPITRDVDRIVAYIDPEDATPPTGDDDIAEVPGMIETVLAAINLPRETNLLNQLGRLRLMEREVEIDRASELRLLKRAFAGKLDQAVHELKPIYRARTKAAIAHEIRLAVQSGRSTDDPSVPIDDLPLPNASTARDGRWDKSISAAERMLRIALRLTRSAAGNGPNNPEISDALFSISVSLMQLSQLRAVVFAEAVYALEAGKTPFELSDDDIYRTWSDALTPERQVLIAAIIAEGLRPFIAADVWPPKVAPLGDVDAQTEAFALACEKIEVVRQAAAPISAYHPVPAFRFCRFGANVGTPFWSDGTPIRDKLMGLRLYHFGGFLRPEWRDYDWMWGRLDGATHLIMMLLDLLRTKASSPDAQLSHDLHEWVGADYAEALDAALDGFLNAPPPPETPTAAIANLTLELVRPLHRAIFCEELGLDSATGMSPGGPNLDAEDGGLLSLKVLDDRITQHLHEATAEVHGTAIAELTESAEGRKVMGQLGAAGLRALGEDRALPARAHLRPVLRVAADIFLAATQPGAKRTILRGAYMALVVMLALAPFFLHLWLSGVSLGFATGVCGIALAALLTGSILIVPSSVATILRSAGRIIRPWPVASAVEPTSESTSTRVSEEQRFGGRAGGASFGEVTWARWQSLRLESTGAGATRRAEAQKTYQPLLSEFTREHGELIAVAWSDRGPAAVALTAGRARPFRARRPEYHRVGDWASAENAEVAMLLFRGDSLAERSVELLSPSALQGVLRGIFSISNRIMAANAAQTEESSDTLGRLATQLAKLESYVDQTRQARAVWTSFVGMLVGVAVMAGLALAVRVDRTGADLAAPTIAVLAGGVGATLSVLYRLRTGSWAPPADEGDGTLYLLGLSRPVVGALLGAGAYVLLTVAKVVAAPPNEIYAAVAFVAGFGERYAGATPESGWSGAGRKELEHALADLIGESVEESMRTTLLGPQLANWAGFVSVLAPRMLGVTEGLCIVDPGELFELCVQFGQHETGEGSERVIDIRDGAQADFVTFRVQADSDAVIMPSEEREIEVAVNGQADVTLDFRSPSTIGDHRIWVRISQRNRIVQLIPFDIHVRGIE